MVHMEYTYLNIWVALWVFFMNIPILLYKISTSNYSNVFIHQQQCHLIQWSHQHNLVITRLFAPNGRIKARPKAVRKSNHSFIGTRITSSKVCSNVQTLLYSDLSSLSEWHTYILLLQVLVNIKFQSISRHPSHSTIFDTNTYFTNFLTPPFHPNLAYFW